MSKEMKTPRTQFNNLNEHKKAAKTWFEHHRIRRCLDFIEQYDAAQAWKRLQKKKSRRQIRRVTYTSVAVAASFLLIFTLAYTSLSHNFPHKETELSAVTDSFPEMGSKKATLTLDDGKEIDLGTKEGNIESTEGTIAVSKPNEALVYQDTKKETPKTLKYNTLTVPRGGEYLLVLADGTKVWLNSESSLHYPVSFADKREVALTGEAYFEVAKDSKRPFIVSMAGNKVEVLGTKFNVSAYPENRIYTTLAEGKVKIYNHERSVTLLPNQQAAMHGTGDIKVENVDARLFTSWSQGMYEFRKTELGDIAAQLSRWYNVDICFNDEKLKHKRFAGVIFRNNELSFAIEVIEKVSNVKFIRENNKIYITNSGKGGAFPL